MKTNLLTGPEEPKAELYDQINLTYLKTVSNGSLEFEKDMLESALIEMEEKMNMLKWSVLLMHEKTISLQAHSLKTLSSIIGCLDLYEQFKDIEAKHTQGNCDPRTAQQCSDAETMWKGVKAQMEKVIATYQ